MKENMQKLWTPFNIGKVQIKNRFAMGPMGDGTLFDSRAGYTDQAVEFYTERAKGGFGLIYTGVMFCDTTIDPGSGNSPLVYASHFLDRASRLNERCNAYDAKVFAEIGLGTGRNYPGMRAPSPVEVFNYPAYKGIEITVDEIHKKTEQFVKCSAIMKKSGFAGIDIHTLHWGYLLDEFVLSLTNKREDEYGGSLENRMRLVKELITGIKQVCGSDYPVTIGLGGKSFVKALNKASLTGEEEAGRTVEEAVEIAKMLEGMGFDAIMTDTGIYDSFYYACPPSYMPKGHGLDLYATVKEAVKIPVLGRSRMGDPELCAQAVNDGKIDAVVLARPSLADPYFPRKIADNKCDRIRPCIGCNVGCIGYLLEQGKGIHCAVNPRTGKELFSRPKKSVLPRKIAIIGGGPGGMQAALTASDCGHTVELFEKENKLGGELISAGAHKKTKEDISIYCKWLINEMNENKIPVHLNSEFNADMVKKERFDTVILATGASPIVPSSIHGIEKAVTAVDFLEGKCSVGNDVIVVGGGMVGAETAVELAMEGKNVTLVERLNEIMSAEFVPQQHKMMLNDMLAHYNVNVLTGHGLTKVTDEGAVVKAAADGNEKLLKADNVILSIGMKPNPTIYYDLVQTGADVYTIGSAKRPGNIILAVEDAFEIVYNFD